MVSDREKEKNMMDAWTRNWLDHGADAKIFVERAESQARLEGVEARSREELLEEARQWAQELGDE